MDISQLGTYGMRPMEVGSSVTQPDMHVLTSSHIDFIPYLYVNIHQTYITHITNCYPSYPNHIVTTSMDGYNRLTSLLDPFADTIVANRSRIAPIAACWVDAIHAAISTEEGAWVKYFPLRRFYSATVVSRHGGIANSIAASRMHPFIISGGTEGEAIFANPARRIFLTKVKSYQLTWFQLEFAATTGIFRMNEGFKLEMKESSHALVHSTVNTSPQSFIL